MIVDFGGLEKIRGTVAMVDGGFDPLHQGHLAYIEEAAKLGAPVLVNVASDAYIATKHPVLLAQENRVRLVDALRSVAYVHPSSRSTAEILEQVRPKYFVKGKHWENNLPDIEKQICDKYGIQIVFADTILDSSTALVKKLMDTSTLTEQVSNYEDFVLNQKPTSPDDYDANYFTSTWREQKNEYTIEARRRIEARNPALIKETFKPQKVLDMGCGPGALMYLLWELGVVADGVDFAPSSLELAPAEVRDHIQLGSVVDVALPTNGYDLVICREVFEHLSVLQVQQAVQNLCRITSRYVYLTTRFHPAPKSLFDVTTEFEVDPTHITLQNMDMLRLMFVLQGMKRRRDLEQTMDWLNKGRVLVYEKML